MGRWVGDDAGDVGQSRATETFVGCGKEFEFYSKCVRESSEHLKEWSYLILKGLFWLLGDL